MGCSILSCELLFFAGDCWGGSVGFRFTTCPDLFWPVAGDRSTSFLNCIPQDSCGSAYDGVAVFVKHDYLVVVRNHVLAAFVVEQYDVIRLLLLVVDDYSRTALAKRLDNLSGLRTGAAFAGAAKSILSATHSARNF